ncbi:uncharacterized protein METZ01_LOCUS356706 [marine metagenome]|uniref:Uncharacterized protein n=1 Tax=marine metagenome TaxID=408172 RepID=A0A382S2S8_9ZZZZ
METFDQYREEIELLEQVEPLDKIWETESLTEISSTVEELKELFFSRYSYSDDVEWLINVGSLIHELCEQTGNEDHHMYPKEEFIESYVSG